jgi:hypothetical protein
MMPESMDREGRPKMRKFIFISGLVLAMAANAAAFELPGAASLGGAASAPSPGVADLLKQVDTVKGNYAGATNSMASGRKKVLSAFGLKAEAAALKTNLSPADVTPEKVTAATDALGNADGTLKKALTERKKLAKDGKKQLVDGMKDMAAGIKKDAALSGQVAETGKSAGGALKGAGVADIPKVQAATALMTALGSKLPVDLAATRDTLSLCADYAKAFNVKVPAGVAEALAAPK